MSHSSGFGSALWAFAQDFFFLAKGYTTKQITTKQN
jgi:hypothetical protein